MSRGRLITVEGIDGAGKTTLAVALEAALKARGIQVQLLRDPGGVRAAERVRELLKDPGLQIGARAEALLYAAARAQLVEEAVGPLLAGGSWVLLDRFVDSSLAYQGAGRQLGLEAVGTLNEFGTHGLRPDRTLLLMIDARLGRARARQRADPFERFEGEPDELFDRIVSGYLELWGDDPGRIKQIDAAQPPAGVLAAALDAIADLL